MLPSSKYFIGLNEGPRGLTGWLRRGKGRGGARGAGAPRLRTSEELDLSLQTTSSLGSGSAIAAIPHFIKCNVLIGIIVWRLSGENLGSQRRGAAKRSRAAILRLRPRPPLRIRLRLSACIWSHSIESQTEEWGLS